MKKILLILSLVLVTSVQTGPKNRRGCNLFHSTTKICVFMLGVMGNAFQANGGGATPTNGGGATSKSVCEGYGRYNGDTGVMTCSGTKHKLSVPVDQLECTGGVGTVEKNGAIRCKKGLAVKGSKGSQVSCEGDSHIDGPAIECEGILRAPYNRTGN